MTDLESLSRVVRDTLYGFPLRLTYPSEQRDLQPHVQSELGAALRESFPDAQLRVVISVGGTAKPCVKLLGTSFWPDVEVTDNGERLLGIEVKLIRPGGRPSASIAEAIGQAVMYSCLYRKVFALVVHLGRYDKSCSEYDSQLATCLSKLNVELITRRPDNVATA